MIAELRGRGRHWQVWYEDETAIQTPVPIHRVETKGNDLDAGTANRRGTLVGFLHVDGFTPRASDKIGEGHFVQSHFEGTKAEADEYARYLGADTIVVRHRKYAPKQIALPIAA